MKHTSMPLGYTWTNDAGSMLSRYYSKELLASELARQHYLLPDRYMLPDA